MKYVRKTTALVALLLGAQAAAAGEFSVTPVRIFMAPRDRAVAITVANEGTEEVVMQADLYAWTQKPGGEDELTLTEDVILSPPILKLAPKSRQVVRLARLGPPPTTEQATYRMIVREIPEARPPAQDMKVQIALSFSLPVFITPAHSKRELQCVSERTGADAVRVLCRNGGTAFAQPRDFVLTSAAGEQLATREQGGYILPRVERSFDLKRAEGRIPGGKHTLRVTLDDGSLQSFPADLPE